MIFLHSSDNTVCMEVVALVVRLLFNVRVNQPFASER